MRRCQWPHGIWPPPHMLACSKNEINRQQGPENCCVVLALSQFLISSHFHHSLKFRHSNTRCRNADNSISLVTFVHRSYSKQKVKVIIAVGVLTVFSVNTQDKFTACCTHR